MAFVVQAQRNCRRPTACGTDPRGQGARVGLRAILYFLKTLCSEKKREAQHLGMTAARLRVQAQPAALPAHVCSLL